MTENETNISKVNKSIEQKIEEAKAEIETILEDKNLVKDPIELEQLERKIVRATDKLASAILAQKLQQSVESPELKQEGAKLAKSFPQKMKDQGIREVTINPSRGEPFTIRTTYFSQGKKKEKKRRILSLSDPIRDT